MITWSVPPDPLVLISEDVLMHLKFLCLWVLGFWSIHGYLGVLLFRRRLHAPSTVHGRRIGLYILTFVLPEEQGGSLSAILCPVTNT